MKRRKKEIKVELIPVYIPHEEFLEKKAEIQDLIAKILLQAHNEDQKTESSVRLPLPSAPSEVGNG